MPSVVDILSKFYNNEGWEEVNGITEDAKRYEDLRECARIYISKCRLRLLNYIPLKGKNFLDIGSGLGVFPYSIKKIGWNCVSVDPDINSVQHLISDLKIKTLHGNYYKIKYAKKFDFVTLNKVLEHVNNPIKFLQKTNKNLDNSGIIYLEVPDAEKASKYGKNREEFFIDHLHVFSKVSLKLMCKKAGFEILHISRIKEPSGKYTLYGFLKK